MAKLVDLLWEINERLQETNRRIAGLETRGKIPPGGVDAEKKKVRIVIGKDPEGNDVLSPWVSVKQVAGALKLHSLPSEGQSLVIRSETGDLEQGVAEPFHWTDENPSPSDNAAEHVLTLGDVMVKLVAGGLTLTVGGVSFHFSAEGFTQSGGTIKHDGVTIDKSHNHTGVVPGGGLSGPPPG